MVNRRSFLKNAAAAGGIVVWAGETFAANAAVVKGRITAAGKGMGGVVVTDGLVCVETGSDGEWTLPVRNGARFISITIPSGWKAPSHYMKYEGPGRSYEFRLERWQASDPGVFKIMHIGDSEIKKDRPEEREWIARAKKWADEENCAFIVHTGDISGRVGLQNHVKLMNCDNMGRPVFYVLGNHDLVTPGRGEEVYEEFYGPCWHSFDAGGVHFIVTPMMRGDGNVSYTVDEIVAWLKNDLAIARRKAQPVMLLTHGCYDSGIYEMKDFYNRTRMTTLSSVPLDIMAACDFRAIIHGHLHSTYFRRTDDGRVEVASVSPPQKGYPALQLIKVCADRKLDVTNRFGTKERWNLVVTPPAGGWISKVSGPVSYSEPCVSGGRLFVGTCDLDGKGGAGVTALDSASGRQLWHAPMRDSVHSRLHCKDGRVFVFDSYWGVHAMDEATGREIWFRDMRREFGIDQYAPGWGCHPLTRLESTMDVESNRLYVGNAMRLIAGVDLDSGKVVWRNDKRGVSFGNTPAACGVAEGRILASCDLIGLFCYDATTGALLWRNPDPAAIKGLPTNERVNMGYPWTRRIGRPLMMGDKAYLTSTDKFLEIDMGTGKVLRELKIEGRVLTHTQPVLRDGRFYFGSTQQGLVCVDAQSFKKLWNAPVGETIYATIGYTYPPIRALSSIPVFHGGFVWGACEDGAVYAWDPVSGEERKRIDTGAPYLASLTSAEGRLYAADFAGYIRASAPVGHA